MKNDSVIRELKNLAMDRSRTGAEFNALTEAIKSVERDKRIEGIIEEMCDFCKYPNLYLATYIDTDDANEHMINEVCKDCPLDRLRGNT